MSVVTRFPQGAPSWLDLATGDVAGAVDFYSHLFGWTAERDEVLTLRGLPLCGVHAERGTPAWTVYLAVTSIAEAMAGVTAAGGEVLQGPTPVDAAGTMALVRDPAGAEVGVWQAGRVIGTRVINEAGAPAWHELASRDPKAAAAFYQQVFGWVAQPGGEDGPDYPLDDTPAYTMWQVEGMPVCGMVAIDETWDAATPSHWMPYFATLDTDATVARAVELGGHAEGSPADSPHGRFATLRDPQGAVFSVIRSTV